jgi:hypothetical protein
MKGIVVLTAASALLSYGCAGTPGDAYTVYIDSNFTIAQQQSILSALDEWHQAVASYDAGVALTFYPVVGSFQECGTMECEHAITIRWDTMAQLDAMIGVDALGRTSHHSVGDWANIWMPVDGKDADPTTFHTAILHELGHGMDLEHTGPGTLMYYQVGADNPGYVTCADVAQWASWRGTVLPVACH